MLNGKTVAVFVPAYNEESQIGIVIDTMPDFVDRIIIVNDCSTDRTEEIIKGYIEKIGDGGTVRIPKLPTVIEETFFNRADVVAQEIRNEEEALYQPHTIFNDNDYDRIVLINHARNFRNGAALRLGYKWCRDHGIDCTGVMGGDAQMDPSELEMICMPVLEEGVDYVKGNRLSHPAAKRFIPKKRHFGNSVLSALTKVASGYWRISDTQVGFTSISLNALNRIKLYSLYHTYGVPNDLLIKLNIAKCSIKELDIKPVYAIGEQSKMKIFKVIPTVSWLLFKGYFKRIIRKYLLNDFHPIFVFYFISWICGLGSLWFLVSILMALVPGLPVTVGTYMGFTALLVTTLITAGFGMWFDVADNDRLQK